jgi:hypothetical protein
MNIGLRSVKFEPLPSEDQQNEGAAAAKSTGSGAGLLQKARSALKRAKPKADPAALFADALPDLKAMSARWEAINAESERKRDLSAYIARAEEAQKRFDADSTPENHERLYLASAVLQAAERQGQFEQRAVYRGDLQQRWLKEFPKARDTVRRALQARLAMAESDLEPDRIKARQRELAEQGDFDAVGAVRKERQCVVEFWKSQLQRIEEPIPVYDAVLDADRLLDVIRVLLEGAEFTKGKFIDSAGELFTLDKVLPVEDPDSKTTESTHYLSSVSGKKSWIGTEQEFQKVFRPA